MTRQALGLVPVLCLVFSLEGFVPASGAALEDPFALVDESETVTGLLKRPQPLSETPSAVTVITAAEIRANGYRTVGEALQWVRGFFVTNDRNYDYVGVRGLLRPGDYNNKVLLTLDGHSLNGSVYGDALFGPELGIDVDQLERIEVVRGPGSALYGSNAVLAVVNLVLRRPQAEPGITVRGRAGGPGEKSLRVGSSSARPDQPAWSVSASYLAAAGLDLAYPEFATPQSPEGRVTGGDGERAVSFLGHAEWKTLRLAVKVNDRLKHIPTGSFGTIFDDNRNRSYDGHDFVELSGSRQLGQTLELFGRSWWDGSRYRAFFVYDGGSSSRIVSEDRGEGDVLGTEWRANWSPGPGHVITAGIEGQAAARIQLYNADLEPAMVHLDRKLSGGLAALYAQDELALGDRLRLTAGTRLDGTRGFTPVVSPRLDVAWRMSPHTVWKLLAGSAFRAPVPYESDYEIPGTVASQSLRPERVRTFEGTLEHAHGAATLTLSAFHQRIVDLIDVVRIDTLGTLQYQNRGGIDGRGIEGEIAIVAGGGTRARAALSWLDNRDRATRSEPTNSPRWSGHVILSHAPRSGPFSAGFGVRFLSPRLTLSGAHTATEVVADGRIGLQLSRATLGLEARNLFDHRYGDPSSAEFVQDQIAQDTRMFFFTVSVHAPYRL